MTPSEQTRHTVTVNEALLGHNAAYAERNRQRFVEKGVRVLSLVSSPGSGKTALLERTLAALQGTIAAGVIVGDLQTDNDAQRLRGKSAPVVQVTTGDYCHLEASMVAQALHELPLDGLRLLFIENVGNLVCPASYDLGEARRVVLLSVTEGEDKPLKYPVIFRNADLVIVSKRDIAEAVGIDLEALRANVTQAAPQAERIELSARTGEGFDAWIAYLHRFLA